MPMDSKAEGAQMLLLPLEISVSGVAETASHLALKQQSLHSLSCPASRAQLQSFQGPAVVSSILPCLKCPCSKSYSGPCCDQLASLTCRAPCRACRASVPELPGPAG